MNELTTLHQQLGAREIPQQLKTHTTLIEDQSLVSSIHIRQFTTTFNSSPRRFNAFSALQGYLYVCMYVCLSHTYTCNLKTKTSLTAKHGDANL